MTLKKTERELVSQCRGDTAVGLDATVAEINGHISHWSSIIRRLNKAIKGREVELAALHNAKTRALTAMGGLRRRLPQS